MKQFLFIAVCVIGSISIYAQKTLKGKVVDATSNKPLNGATITFQNKEFTTSDEQGYFSFDCNKNTRITVSFVGYQSKQHVINCNEDVLISLSPSSNTLADVEITSTSAQNKSMLYQPQSITKLGTLELKRSTGIYMDDAINTNIPGVTMQRRGVSSGQTINIRGYGSGIRGTNGISSNFDIQGVKVYLN